MKSNICLIGFMGSGKTEVGKKLSEKLSMEFIDTDDYIEKTTQKSISHLINESEESFRRIEHKIVRNISQLKNKCISTGGGIVLNPENVMNLSKTSEIILLEAKFETIYSRIINDKDNIRPLANAYERNVKIKEIMDLRKEKYLNYYDFRIQTDLYSVSEIVDIIMNYLKKKS